MLLFNERNFLSHATRHPYIWGTVNMTTNANSQGVVYLNRGVRIGIQIIAEKLI
jgi:hypothetical protein